MCLECGCGTPGPYNIDGQPAGAVPSPLTAHTHAHAHGHGGRAGHGHGHAEPLAHGHAHPHDDHHAHRSIDVNQAILADNDRLAERNRGYFKASGSLVLNVVSSPGSGKTTLVQKTIEGLQSRLRVGVVVGDLATDNDATRLRVTGAPVVQITTGTICHLDAEMVARALGKLDLRALDLLVIENVGNLVCPAAFDLGEDLRVVLLSVTEGEDKPLKYPPMFHSADVVLVTKMDLAQATEFKRDTALEHLRKVSHHARIFEVSARTGEGMAAWLDFLVERARSRRAGA